MSTTPHSSTTPTACPDRAESQPTLRLRLSPGAGQRRLANHAIVVFRVVSDSRWVSPTLTNGLDLKPNALALLEVVDDLEQIAGLRIAARPEHAHQALGRLAG